MEMKCVKCGNTATDDAWRERYEELVAQGIVPMMVYVCKDCRDRVITFAKFQLNKLNGDPH